MDGVSDLRDHNSFLMITLRLVEEGQEEQLCGGQTVETR